MKDKSPQQYHDLNVSLQDLIEQWVQQHNTLERYFLMWSLTFGILRKFRIEPTSRKGTILRFWFLVLLLLSPPLIIAALKNEWGTSPVLIWSLIALIYGLASMTYPLYKGAGRNICSLGYTVVDKTDMINQIQWDQKWFNLRLAMIPGIGISLALLAIITVVQSSLAGTIIPSGTYFLIAVVGYQIGESTWLFLLICAEAYKISAMEHKLYWFRPGDTVSIHQSFVGYNQLAGLNSLIITVFIGGLELLLPDQQYLANSIILVYLLVNYLLIGLTIIVPRISIQRVVQASKVQEMRSIQNLLNPLHKKIQDLSTEEFEQLKRLDEIHEIVQSSRANYLPFSTVGRVFGTLFLPTLTFILTTASERYLQTFLGRLFR